MAATSFNITLENDPEAIFSDFETQIQNVFAAECTEVFEHGLYHLIATDEQWETATGNTEINEAGANITKDRPTTAMPADLAANPTSAAISLYVMRRAQHVKIKETAEKLKQRLILSLGVENFSIISDPTHGTRNISALEIMQIMRDLYGVPSASVLNVQQMQLEVPILAEQSFGSLSSQHRNIHAKLVKANQPMSEFQKVTLLVKAMATRSDMMRAVEHYKSNFPAVAMQNFEGLVKHIREQAPNMTAAAAGYAGAAIHRGEDMISRHEVADLIAAAVKAAVAESRTNDVAARTQKMYCYLHGYCAHSGKKCNTMLNDSKFTAQQKGARNHTAVAGGSSKGQN